MNANEQMDRIEKMLRAQLKSAGHVWWVNGWVYGVTSNGDVFIILYPADEKLNEKVVRVYPHDFKKLPPFIKTDVDGGDTEANPNKEQARRKGIYHEGPLFEIVTYDGKETQMGRERRFGDVLRVTNVERNAQRQPAPASPPPPPPPPDEPAGQASIPGTVAALPDYREMAIGAKTATEFDYAAYMVLKNGLYTEVGRITATREVLASGWKPGPKANGALLVALGVYRDKRSQAEGRGESTSAAHAFAKREAMNAYNKEIGR